MKSSNELLDMEQKPAFLTLSMRINSWDLQEKAYEDALLEAKRGVADLRRLSRGKAVFTSRITYKCDRQGRPYAIFVARCRQPKDAAEHFRLVRTNFLAVKGGRA